MKYLICKDVYEDYDDSIIYISTEETTEKNDLVVYNGYNRPSLANEYSASNEPLIPLLRATLSGN